MEWWLLIHLITVSYRMRPTDNLYHRKEIEIKSIFPRWYRIAACFSLSHFFYCNFMYIRVIMTLYRILKEVDLHDMHKKRNDPHSSWSAAIHRRYPYRRRKDLKRSPVTLMMIMNSWSKLPDLIFILVLLSTLPYRSWCYGNGVPGQDTNEWNDQ